MADTTQVVQYQTGFPSEIAPFAQRNLGLAQALTDTSQNPYMAYTGERTAQFTPLQQQAFAGATNLAPAYQIAGASGIAGMAGQQALGSAGQYTPTNYSTQSITQPGVLQPYMSPYMQSVVDIQQREAKRQADIANQTMQAKAAAAGAFGGGRMAVQQGEANRALQTQLAGIQATGLQNAYQQGIQQFNQEQQARQAAAQLQEQSRQYGAGLGMQGLQTGIQAAQQLGALGQAQFGQEQGALNLQQQYGALQQQQMQDILNQQYQTWQASRQYPYQQIAFMSDILRGQPLYQQSQTASMPSPTPIQNLASLGLGAYGISNLFGGTGKAKGGLAEAYAEGGSVTSDENVEGILSRLSAEQLEQAKQVALRSNDQDRLMLINREMQKREALRTGMEEPEAMAKGGIIFVEPGTGRKHVHHGHGAKHFGEGKAGGGIIAFGPGGVTDDEDEDEEEPEVADDEYDDNEEMDGGLASLYSGYAPAPAADEEAGGGAEAAGSSAGGGGEEGVGGVGGVPGVVRTAPGRLPADVYRVREGLDQAAAADTTGMTADQLHNLAVRRALASAAESGTYNPKQLTEAERDAELRRVYALQEKLAGPNEAAAKLKEYLEKSDTARAQSLQESKGIAALRAAAAVLQPGGTMRGLAAAGSAFGETYGKALQADRARQDALKTAQFNLLDAERKEKLGFTKSAMASLSAYQKNINDAEKARLSALRYKAEADARIAQATKPPAVRPAAAAKPSQLAEGVAIYAAEIRRENPDMPESKVRAQALQKFNQEKSAGLPGVTTRTEATAADKAAERANNRLTMDPEFLAAQRKKDSKAMEKRRGQIFDEERRRTTDNGVIKLD